MPSRARWLECALNRCGDGIILTYRHIIGKTKTVFEQSECSGLSSTLKVSSVTLEAKQSHLNRPLLHLDNSEYSAAFNIWSHPSYLSIMEDEINKMHISHEILNSTILNKDGFYTISDSVVDEEKMLSPWFKDAAWPMF